MTRRLDTNETGEVGGVGGDLAFRRRQVPEALALTPLFRAASHQTHQIRAGHDPGGVWLRPLRATSHGAAQGLQGQAGPQVHQEKGRKSIASFLNQKYGEGRVTADISDTYYNMREKVEPDYMFLVDGAVEAFKKLDVVPKVVPIRGGTDGAALSYKGLPCPNLCAGGHNFHGIYEYVCIESMEKIVEMLTLLACCNFAK